MGKRRKDHPEVDSTVSREPGDPRKKQRLTRADIAGSYAVAELATLTRDGSPVCWPLSPGFERGRLIFSTGYVYPTKARNAQLNPRVAALFSDPTASGRSDNDPFVLVQGLAEVFDQDLQRNTDRYVDQLLSKRILLFSLMLHTPGLRQLLVGYLARIWIEVTPQNETVWRREQLPPEALRQASRPASFLPKPGIELPKEVFAWLPRYTRPPVLAYVDREGWPVMIRAQAEVRRDHVAIGSEIEAGQGAPACLTYHRLIDNYWANDAFLIRGHFNAEGILIPEKLVGYGGTQNDRGVGSLKVMGLLLDFRKQLKLQLEKGGRPLPIVRLKH